MDFSFITDEALRAKATKAFEDAIAEATSGLQAKNNELLGKLKKAQKGGDIDPADYQAVQDELSKANEKISEMTKQVKTLTKDNETFKKNYEAEAGVTHKLIVQNGLTAALLEAKVKPELMKAVVSMLTPQISVKADGDNRIAVAGDKPLADYVSEWASSDEGKHFVAAPLNQGGGANGGGNGNGNQKQMTRAAFDALDPMKKSGFMKEGGVLVN